MSTKLSTDEQIVLNCAFRYALGRSTYVVGSVVDTILRDWDGIDESQKELFVREIAEHKERFGGIGMDMDEREWYRIVDKFNSENE